MPTKYYAVKKGFVPGLYTTWDKCKIQVHGFPGAIYKSFLTKPLAIEYLTGQLPKVDLDLTCLYVDGAHNKQSGDEGWGRVTDAKGTDLGHMYRNLFSGVTLKDVKLPVGNCTVCVARFKDPTSLNDVASQHNGAELLAMIMGLRLALSQTTLISRQIKSDSSLIVDSWSLNAVKSSNLDPDKLQYINEVIKLRQQYESLGGQIIKISGDENKADLGYHK